MTLHHAESTYILTLSCASSAGQVAAVTAFLEQRGCYIDDIAAYDDKLEQRFFARFVFHPTSDAGLTIEELRAGFARSARASTWTGRSLPPRSARAC